MKENQQETRKRKENEGKPMENERKTYPNRKTKKNPKKKQKKSRKKSAPLQFSEGWKKNNIRKTTVITLNISETSC